MGSGCPPGKGCFSLQWRTPPKHEKRVPAREGVLLLISVSRKHPPKGLSRPLSPCRFVCF